MNTFIEQWIQTNQNTKELVLVKKTRVEISEENYSFSFTKPLHLTGVDFKDEYAVEMAYERVKELTAPLQTDSIYMLGAAVKATLSLQGSVVYQRKTPVPVEEEDHTPELKAIAQEWLNGLLQAVKNKEMDKQAMKNFLEFSFNEVTEENGFDAIEIEWAQKVLELNPSLDLTPIGDIVNQDWIDSEVEIQQQFSDTVTSVLPKNRLEVELCNESLVEFLDAVAELKTTVMMNGKETQDTILNLISNRKTRLLNGIKNADTQANEDQYTAVDDDEDMPLRRVSVTPPKENRFAAKINVVKDYNRICGLIDSIFESDQFLGELTLIVKNDYAKTTQDFKNQILDQMIQEG
jgi:hypothetical protein